MNLRGLIVPIVDLRVYLKLGAATFDDSVRYAFQSDGAAFIRAGIPTLDLNADDNRYEEQAKRGDIGLDCANPFLLRPHKGATIPRM